MPMARPSIPGTDEKGESLALRPSHPGQQTPPMSFRGPPVALQPQPTAGEKGVVDLPSTQIEAELAQAQIRMESLKRGLADLTRIGREAGPNPGREFTARMAHRRSQINSKIDEVSERILTLGNRAEQAKKRETAEEKEAKGQAMVEAASTSTVATWKDRFGLDDTRAEELRQRLMAGGTLDWATRATDIEQSLTAEQTKAEDERKKAETERDKRIKSKQEEIDAAKKAKADLEERLRKMRADKKTGDEETPDEKVAKEVSSLWRNAVNRATPAYPDYSGDSTERLEAAKRGGLAPEVEKLVDDELFSRTSEGKAFEKAVQSLWPGRRALPEKGAKGEEVGQQDRDWIARTAFNSWMESEGKSKSREEQKRVLNMMRQKAGLPPVGG